jgi:hypothetical protein
MSRRCRPCTLRPLPRDTGPRRAASEPAPKRPVCTIRSRPTLSARLSGAAQPVPSPHHHGPYELHSALLPRVEKKTCSPREASGRTRSARRGPCPHSLQAGQKASAPQPRTSAKWRFGFWCKLCTCGMHTRFMCVQTCLQSTETELWGSKCILKNSSQCPGLAPLNI